MVLWQQCLLIVIEEVIANSKIIKVNNDCHSESITRSRERIGRIIFFSYFYYSFHINFVYWILSHKGYITFYILYIRKRIYMVILYNLYIKHMIRLDFIYHLILCYCAPNELEL